MPDKSFKVAPIPELYAMEEIAPEPIDWHQRKCYCFMWHESPELLQEQKLPYGYCGWCSQCKKPGHMRHSPRGPATFAWCDDCWEKLLSEIEAEKNHE